MRDRNLVESRYAEFYDLYVGSFRQDIPIYLDLAAKYSGPMLEVGCATGRVISRLAAAGYGVHGVDSGRHMLEIARRRTRPYADRARISDHDFRHQSLPGKYESAIVTLHKFNSLIEIEEHRLFLRHLRQSLRSPGIVAIDCFCPLSMVHPAEAGESRVIEREVDGRSVVVRDRREMLTPLLERRTQRFRIDAGPEVESISHRRYVSPPQLASRLEEAGFEEIRWVQDYDVTTIRPAEADVSPVGPFLMFAEV